MLHRARLVGRGLGRRQPPARGSARAYLTADGRSFLSNRAHKKQCGCGLPNPVLAAHCSHCGAELPDSCARPTASDALVKLVATNGERRSGFWAPPLVKTWDYFVLRMPYPAGSAHLLVVPKGSALYDIKRLRRAHLDVLDRGLHSALLLLACGAGEALQERVAAAIVAESKGQQPEGSADALVPREALARVTQLALAGFAYPAHFNHVHMHVVLPPFAARPLFPLFRRSRFRLLEEVAEAIAADGKLVDHAPALGLEDEPVAAVHEREAMARSGGFLLR